MKKLFFLLVILFPFITIVSAQVPVFSWASQFSGANGESGRSIAVDLNGNVLSTGIFSGTTDFDPGPGVNNLIATGGQDVYVSKLDSLGNFVWAVKIGGTVVDNSAAIKVDNSGNVYVTGNFNGTCTFGLTTLASSGMGDAYVCKLDPAGNFLWAKKFGSNSNDAGIGICVDGAGNVFSTGYFSNTCDFDPDAVATFNLVSSGGLDIFVSKLDAAGNFVAAYKIGGTGFDLGFDITLDGTGNIYTTGSFSNSVDFDPGAGTTTLSAGTGEDIYVNKLDPSGNSIWAKGMSGNTFTNSGFSLAVDLSGNVYSSGYFSGTVDFDPGGSLFDLTSAGGTDAYVLKLDAAGDFVWAKQTGDSGNDGAYSLGLDAGNNVYAGGDFEGTVDFDPGAGAFNMTAATFDAYVSKLDAAGNFITAIQFATNNGDPSIAVDNGSRLYVTGGFNATTDFDAGAGVSDLVAVGSFDAYVTRYTSCITTSQPGPISGLSPICAGSSNTYSISPVAGATSYTWILPSGWTGTSTTTSINTTASATSGNILVTANNSCGSSVPQTLNVTVSNPMLSLTPVSANCHDSCDGSISPVTTGGVGGYAYMPFPLTDLCPGNYTVTVTDGAGCIGTSTTTIINPAPLAVNANVSDTILCYGEFANINFTGADTYTWNGNPHGASFLFGPAVSTYGIVVGTDTVSGCTGRDSAYFTVHQLPIVNFNYPGPTTICHYDGIQTLSGGTPAGGTYSGPGVTGTSFDPNIAGMGIAEIIYSYTDGNSCENTDTITINVIVCFGIEDNWETSIRVYPNPATDFITIDGIEDTYEVELYNSLGEVLQVWKLNGTNHSISIREYNAGIYLLSIKTSHGTVTKRLVKK